MPVRGLMAKEHVLALDSLCDTVTTHVLALASLSWHNIRVVNFSCSPMSVSAV